MYPIKHAISDNPRSVESHNGNKQRRRFGLLISHSSGQKSVKSHSSTDRDKTP